MIKVNENRQVFFGANLNIVLFLKHKMCNFSSPCTVNEKSDLPNYHFLHQ